MDELIHEAVKVRGAYRGAVEHRVKSWPELFDAALAGTKTHDMRKQGDRDYRVGDFLRLCEFDPILREYSGRELLVVITYVTSADFPCALSGDGLKSGFCILSIKKA